MIIKLLNWVVIEKQVLLNNLLWMSWNLFLALIPLAFSFWLFHSNRSRSWLWWLILCVFIAFLPNAPYVLTDVIHLVDDIRHSHSIWAITLLIIPQYLLFFFMGFEAYVISLVNLGSYLIKQGARRFIIPVEFFLHTLSAIGIYLGRFQRFNSWDIITNLDNLSSTILNDFAQKFPWLIIVITFAILAVSYWFLKQITLGIILLYQRRTQEKQRCNTYQ